MLVFAEKSIFSKLFALIYFIVISCILMYFYTKIVALKVVLNSIKIFFAEMKST